MLRATFTVVLALALGLAGCSESINSATCHRNDDCVAARLCDAAGACVEAAALAITPRSLDDALVGDGSYTQSMQATGGLPPYSWTMTPANGAAQLAWLEIDPTTGELRAKDGQAPASAARDLVIDVAVLDRSNAGEGQLVSQPFTLHIVDCIGAQTCFAVVAGACNEGARACNDGVLSPDCSGDSPSAALEHCGSDCGPCPDTADRCTDGLCRCGAGAPCAAGQACCGAGCFDLNAAQNHCGDCDTDCAAMLHVQDPSCADGRCAYGQCETGFLSCDDNEQNGCETPSDPNNCAACGDRCSDLNVYAHTENQQCDLGVCTYTCLPDYASCDDDPGNGCETPLDTITDCGACDHACPGSNAGDLCLDDGAGGMRCGCAADADCPADRMCCDQMCVPHTENHCGACDNQCAILTGGLACTEIAGPQWECQCAADTDCRGIYAFSKALCDPASDQCICSATENCAGAVDDMCCIKSASLTCVDMTTDADNCGQCGVICATDETCSEGACSCALNAGNCPGNSGAPDCVANECVCSYNGNAPCLPGQTCCQSKGCCLNGCASPIDECSNGCGGNGHIWCDWGCCPDCASAAECAQFAP